MSVWSDKLVTVSWVLTLKVPCFRILLYPEKSEMTGHPRRETFVGDTV
jgi:hypothetical protein